MGNKANLIFSIIGIICLTLGIIVMITNDDIIGTIFYVIFDISAIVNTIGRYKCC